MAVIQETVAAVAAGTATTVDIGVVPAYGGENFAVGEAKLVSRTAQAAQGVTNFCTINLQYTRVVAGVAGAPVVLGSIALSTVALAVDVPASFALGANQEKALLQAGDVLQLGYVHTGTGGAAPAATVEVETE